MHIAHTHTRLTALCPGHITPLSQNEAPQTEPPLGGPEPPSNIWFVPRLHSSPHPKRHLDWFIHFCSSYGCDRQTHKHATDHATSVAIHRILCLAQQCGHKAIPAISGFNLCIIASPLPIGALMKSRKSASGFEAYRFAALHVSITDPPPNARYESNWPCLANSIASLKLHKNSK